MRNLVDVVSVVAVALAVAGIASAQAPRLVRVAIDVHHVATSSRQATGAAGSVIVTERGSVGSRARISANNTTARTTRTTGLFTLVQDGGESSMTIATELPAAEIAYWRDYVTAAGYVAPAVVFRDVGTSLNVHAQILSGERVRVRLTPIVSYRSPEGSGAIQLIQAVSEMIVSSGRPVVIGGATSLGSDVTRRLLGIERRQSGNDATVTLTATVR